MTAFHRQLLSIFISLNLNFLGQDLPCVYCYCGVIFSFYCKYYVVTGVIEKRKRIIQDDSNCIDRHEKAVHEIRRGCEVARLLKP